MKKKFYNTLFSLTLITVFFVSPLYVFAEDVPLDTPILIENETTTSTPASESIPLILESATTTENKPTTDTTVSTTPENTDALVDTISTNPTSVTTHLTLRHENTVIFDTDVTIPDTTTFTYLDFGVAVTTTTDAHSVLTLLLAADAQSDNFRLSDIGYFSSFDSFIVNCIQIETGEGTTACYNWQYVVDGNYPFLGMDKFTVADSQSVYIYFGDRYELTTDKNIYETSENVDATLKEYNYHTNVWEGALHTQVLATEPILPDFSNYPPHTLSATTTNESGVAQFTFSATGTVFITLDSYWPGKTITIVSPTSTTPTSTNSTTTDIPSQSSSGGGGGSSSSHMFSVEQAVQFISSFINSNGSVLDSVLLSDWASIGLRGAGSSGESVLSKIKPYLLSDPSPLVGANHTTDYARRSLALMATGISPYSGTATNYIDQLLSKFNGTQFVDQNGETALVNDDIFALIALENAGYTATDDTIKKTVSFILSQQNVSGSFGSVDLTAAAIQALKPVSSLTGVPEVLEKAKNYLRTNQKTDGGFGDIYGTSWSLQALSSLGENPESWTMNGNTPRSYLTSNQVSDGGVLSGDTNFNRAWATSYAIPGYLGKSWTSILSSFAKPTTATPQPQNTGTGATNPETNATTTVPIVTSTPSVSTTPTSTLVVTTTIIHTNIPTTTAEQSLDTISIPTASENSSLQVIPLRIVRGTVPAVLGEKITKSTDTTNTPSSEEPVDSDVERNDSVPMIEEKNQPHTKRTLFIGSLVIFFLLISYLIIKSLKSSDK